MSGVQRLAAAKALKLDRESIERRAARNKRKFGSADETEAEKRQRKSRATRDKYLS